MVIADLTRDKESAIRQTAELLWEITSVDESLQMGDVVLSEFTRAGQRAVAPPPFANGQECTTGV